MRVVRLGIFDEKTAALMANPLHDSRITGAAEQRGDTIQWVRCATAGALGWRFRPFVNHGQRQPRINSHLFDVGSLKDLAQEFMRFHEREE